MNYVTNFVITSDDKLDESYDFKYGYRMITKQGGFWLEGKYNKENKEFEISSSVVNPIIYYFIDASGWFAISPTQETLAEKVNKKFKKKVVKSLPKKNHLDIISKQGDLSETLCDYTNIMATRYNDRVIIKDGALDIVKIAKPIAQYELTEEKIDLWITAYRTYLQKRKGKIYCDISAGFDTRCMIFLFNDLIDGYIYRLNPNQRNDEYNKVFDMQKILKKKIYNIVDLNKGGTKGRTTRIKGQLGEFFRVDDWKEKIRILEHFRYRYIHEALYRNDVFRIKSAIPFADGTLVLYKCNPYFIHEYILKKYPIDGLDDMIYSTSQGRKVVSLVP